MAVRSPMSRSSGRCSPVECVGCRKERIEGDPDMKHVSTSYAERANLTMGMHNRRFTRLTNAFSKKFENHAHMVAIYAVWYNWLRIHKSLRVTPAMAAGLSEAVMDWTDIVEAMDADATAKKTRSLQKDGRTNFKLRHYLNSRPIDTSAVRSSVTRATVPRSEG